MSRITVFPVGKPEAPNTGAGERFSLASHPPEKGESVVSLHRLCLANFFVAAKSCPRLVLAGPPGSGKVVLARLYARLLGDERRMASMVGHARWAAGSANSGMLVEAQARLNKSALFDLIAEAWRPQQQHLPFVACLKRISPAELDTFFTPQGLDLLYRQFLGWRATIGLPLLPLPPNLSLVATLDTERFCWWDISFLDDVLVVPWPASASQVVRLPPAEGPPALCKETFLRDAIRDPVAAHRRLQQLLPSSHTPFQRLLQVAGRLEEHGVTIPREVVNRATIFVANAWSPADAGLFVQDPSANLDHALQLGIIQNVIPWLAVHRQTSLIRDVVLPLLDDFYEPLITLLGG